MLAVYDDWGKRWPCTVLHLDDCRVVQVRGEAARTCNILLIDICALYLGQDTRDRWLFRATTRRVGVRSTACYDLYISYRRIAFVYVILFSSSNNVFLNVE